MKISQNMMLMHGILELDPRLFIVLNNVHEVAGEGFTDYVT